MRTLTISLFAILLTSCSNTTEDSALMVPYNESCHLIEHDLDSVNRFDSRFHAVYPFGSYGAEDLYSEIEGNVEKAKAYFTCGITLTIDTAWAGSIEIPY